MSRPSLRTIAISGAVLGLCVVGTVAAQSGRPAASPAAPAATLCTDGQGPTSGFFCAPRVQDRPVVACTRSLSGTALADCRQTTATGFCQSAGFTRASLFGVNAQGQLVEVTCSERQASSASATSNTTASAAPSGTPSLTLYADAGFAGSSVVLTATTSSLVSVPAAGSDSGTANDFGYSAVAVGRWQICRDVGFAGGCREITGRVDNLGDYAQSVSSVRYLGPASSPTPSSSGGAPVSAPAPAPSGPEANYTPLYSTDMFGNDLPSSFEFTRPGATWQQCAAACDADRSCQAFTFVPPGRTTYGECFLKAPVPAAGPSECCISGVKGSGPANAPAGPGTAGARSGNTGNTGSAGQQNAQTSAGREETAADRIAREAAAEAERRASEEARRGVNRVVDGVLGRPN